jgi:hypothetical protein
MDGSMASDDSMSRVYNYGDASAATAGQSGNADEEDTFGLVTKFNVITAVSRKTHGGAGSFDVSLPLGGLPGVECRDGGASGDYQMVITFPTAVTLAGAQVTQGTGTASSTNTNNNQIFVNLTGVTNAQTIPVTLLAVNDGIATNNITLPMSILVGDTTGNGAVNSSDVALTKAESGKSVTASNFREDVTADGSINSTDVSLAKSKSGTGISATKNSARVGVPAPDPDTRTR